MKQIHLVINLRTIHLQMYIWLSSAVQYIW
uniref:Uncharacterized protein n=1 Tax=Anguilla anguilla TaxID=7936 RepID=A0A0E9SHR0_ANGAN